MFNFLGCASHQLNSAMNLANGTPSHACNGQCFSFHKMLKDNLGRLISTKESW